MKLALIAGKISHPLGKSLTTPALESKAQTARRSMTSLVVQPQSPKYKSKSLYKRLGVPREASARQIKQAYRAMSKVYHPDNKVTGDAEAFEAINEAYTVLIDPAARAEYDETGKVPDNRWIDDKARQAMTQIMETVIEQEEDPDHSNIIAKCLKVMGQQEQENNKAITQCGKEIKKVKNIRRRLKFRGKGEGIFDGVLAKKEKDQLEMTEALKKNGLVIKAVIRMLQDYEYEFDPEPPRFREPTWTTPAGSTPRFRNTSAFDDF